MKFGLMFANGGPFSEPATAVGLAQLAEEVGFESLWTVEHVCVPTGYQSAYPYSPTGKMPGGEDVPIPDPLIWLAYVAAATTRIRLATGILILPQRNPVILAKEIATLDRLSGGRVELGVGVGWLEEEFDALGVPWAARGRRTDEYIDVLRRMWREPETAFDGEFTKFAPLKSCWDTQCASARFGNDGRRRLFAIAVGLSATARLGRDVAVPRGASHSRCRVCYRGHLPSHG